MSDQSSDSVNPLVVGIGASAGGVDALKKFFSSFSEEPGMAFIVIIHLSPDYDSSLAELLQGQTSLKVMQVNERTEIKENHVYVIPPSKMLTVSDNHLELSDSENNKRPQVVDQFYRSLGNAKGDKAVCITLSGTGSDGATGMKAIKEKGGLTIVQDPVEAQYNGMPQSAIDTGLTDKVLSVKQMPQALKDYKRSLSVVRIPDKPEELSESEQEIVSKIFDRIQSETEHDFSQYKQTTMLRRIKRRMHVHSVKTLDEYLSVLNDDTEEAQELFKDLLISVTNFFRDPEAYDVLESKVIAKIFENKRPDDEVRVWVPGCATGEEAYSIAMLLHKYARNLRQSPSIQIFATDIDEHALDVARQGKYPESIAGDLSEQHLQRFFTKYGHEYVVKEELRNLILFSKHDLLRNPPFLNQDLVSCRNLLIYLDRNLQKAVFNLFHYALNAQGRLFLGSSDSNLQAVEKFSPIDKQYRIYRKRSGSKSQVHLPSFPLKFSQNKPSTNSWRMPSETKSNFEQLHRRLMTRHYAPPSVIINENEEVLHATEGIGGYLTYTEGEPSRNILEMVISDLRQPLRSILYQIKNNEIDLPARKQVWIKTKEQSELIAVNVHRVIEKDFPDDLILIVFKKKRDGEDTTEGVADKRDFSEEEVEIIEELENELKQTKEQLELTVADYETSNEELRSSNEELQSMNEELQSMTEELETSKEELQSVNEELRTVNQELEHKVDELSRANSDLKNLMEATEVAIIFVDRDFCLKRFTSKATDIFNLTSADIDRPLEHFTHQLEYDSLMSEIKNVLDSLEKTQKEVNDKEGNTYVMRLRPYHTVDGNISGVVITFVDVTDIKAAEAKLRAANSELADKIESIKKLQRQILKANVNERWKVGQYLHDELAQQLLVAQLTTDRLQGNIKEEDLATEIAELKEVITKALSDVRDLSHEIIPVDIEQMGIEDAFKKLATKIEKVYGLNCVLKGDSVMDYIDDIEVATNLYRIAHEAAKNSAIHGDAENVFITLRSDGDYLYLEIEDDGVGFEATESGEEGMGINIMRHRMELMDGTLDIKKATHFDKGGACVACRMPLDD